MNEKNASNVKTDGQEVSDGGTGGTPDNLKAIVNEELARMGSGGPWVWKLFFLCALPNILNGFHVSSYIFLGQRPDKYWCNIEALQKSNWTTMEMRHISSTIPMELGNGCSIKDYDYNYLGSLNYSQAMDYVSNHTDPAQISCLKKAGVSFHYEMHGNSIVNEWDLVCENEFWRTSTQVAVSFGKFVGASVFGILSDKYGRKNSFTLGAVFYTVGSLLTSFSPWYWPFLVGRMMLGSASSGLFYPALTICMLFSVLYFPHYGPETISKYTKMVQSNSRET